MFKKIALMFLVASIVLGFMALVAWFSCDDAVRGYVFGAMGAIILANCVLTLDNDDDM